MLAMWERIERTRAQRMLDALQVQSAQHMEGRGYRAFVNGLIGQCSAAVTAVADHVETVIWNGKVLGTARAMKAKAHELLGRGVAA